MIQQKRLRNLSTLLVGLCLISMPATALAGYADVIMADTPVLYYGMNETGGNLDDASANDAAAVTIGSGMTYGEIGPITNDANNTAITFDGASSFEMATDGILDFGTDQDFSIELWFKTDFGGSTGEVNPFFNEGDTYAGFWARQNAGDLQALLDYSAVVGGPQSDSVSIATGSTNNQWHHFALVADRDTALTLYIDGEVAATDSSMYDGGATYPSNVSNDLSLFIGAMGTRFYTGSMDEFAIYDEALTSTQIGTHIAAATATATVPEPSTIVLLLAGLAGLFVIRRR